MFSSSFSLLVYVVVIGIVASQSYLSSESQTVGEEDLCGCLNPHLKTGKKVVKGKFNECNVPERLILRSVSESNNVIMSEHLFICNSTTATRLQLSLATARPNCKWVKINHRSWCYKG